MGFKEGFSENKGKQIHKFKDEDSFNPYKNKDKKAKLKEKRKEKEKAFDTFNEKE